MNLGLGNLIELKRYLLAAGVVASIDFDAAITAIGKGVARLFDRHCNRIFERGDNITEEFSADRRVWITKRFPIELISSIEQRDTSGVPWTGLVVENTILQRDDKAGIIKFGSTQGTHLSQMRLTYSGGYWFDTTEDGSGVMPAGATLLPEDVKLAWFIQCAEVWNKKDKLGKNITKDDATFVSQLLMSLDFVPQVKAILNGHVRYQLT
jgi:hypothetical protein